MAGSTDPFGLHPDAPAAEKTQNKSLTLSQVRDIIKRKMKTVEEAPEPRWGYSSHHVCSLLSSLIDEMEKNCQIS